MVRGMNKERREVGVGGRVRWEGKERLSFFVWNLPPLFTVWLFWKRPK